MTRCRALLLLAPALPAILLAQTPAPPTFRFERPVVVTGDGPHRLTVDVPLLAGAEPGLKDLRFYDAGGREIGYLLIGNPPAAPTYTEAAILDVAPTDTRTSRSSAFEADLGTAKVVDRLRLDGLPAPFLKRVKLEGSADREHWTLLVGDGSLFDLPQDRLRQTEVTFAAGSFRYLRLTWDDTNSGRLPHPSAVVAGMRGTIVPPPPLTAPLAFERRAGEPFRSYFRVRLPAARLPIAALEFDVGGAHLMREATVFEARLVGNELRPVRLGQAVLRRVIAGDVAASALRVPIDQPPTDSQLDITFEDGDNPPLDLRGVKAVFAELPWIYFEAPAGSIAARFGSTTLEVPRYDLEAMRRDVRIETVPNAEWGDARARTAEENAGAAPPLPTVGSPLDTALFRYVRALPPGSAALVAVPLDAALLAHSAGPTAGFADVRVIDGEGRQVPYVLERASEPLSIEATLERVTTPPPTAPPGASTRSFYRLRWPDPRLPAARLSFSTKARVFDRRVSVGVEHEPDARRRDRVMEIVVQGVWRHAAQDRPAQSLVVSIPSIASRRPPSPTSSTPPQRETTELVVIVDEGDNAPLPLEPVRILLPSYRVRFFRDANASLRLAYGRTDLSRPQYDLALLAPQVLRTPATEIAPAGEPAASPDRGPAALLSPAIFWAALGVAALVLVALIARLLQKEQPSGQA